MPRSGGDTEKQTAPLIILTHAVQSWRWEEMNSIQNIVFLIVFIKFDWLGSNNLKKKKKKKKQTKIELWLFFLPPLYLIFWVSARMESFAFELVNASLTVPDPPLTRRAGITLINAVIATAGDSSSCLLPTGPKNQNSGIALCLGCLMEVDFTVRDSWVQQDFSSGVLCLPQLQLLKFNKCTK